MTNRADLLAPLEPDLRVFVSLWGDDKNTGLSPAQAKRTFAATCALLPRVLTGLTVIQIGCGVPLREIGEMPYASLVDDTVRNPFITHYLLRDAPQFSLLLKPVLDQVRKR